MKQTVTCLKACFDGKALYREGQTYDIDPAAKHAKYFSFPDDVLASFKKPAKTGPDAALANAEKSAKPGRKPKAAAVENGDDYSNAMEQDLTEGDVGQDSEL